MSRGRPPKRAKEEALRARREQVRKNVQAFRTRKQAQKGATEGTTEAIGDAHVFVLEDLGQTNSRDQGQHGAITEDTNSGVGKCSEEPPTSALDYKTSQRRLLICHHPSTTSDLDCLIALPPVINPASASLQQFTSAVAYTFLPTIPTQRSNDTHWSQILPALVKRDDTLDLSIQALCLLQYTHFNGGQHLKPHSLQTYDCALKSLQLAIARPTICFRAEIFAAMMALGTYELLQGSDTHGGWMYHMKGATSYLKKFPSSNIGPFSHQLSFHFLETVCIFDALGSRKSSSFSRSMEWRHRVDRFGGEIYGPLLRMLTSLPDILEQCDNALLAEPKEYEHLIRPLRLCLRMEDAFLDWFCRITQNGSVQVPYTEDTTTGSDHPSTPDDSMPKSGSQITYSTLYTARLYLLYWSSMILLYESITDLLHNLCKRRQNEGRVSIPVGDSMHATLSSQAYTSSSHSFATCILRSISFCLKPKQGVVGKSLVLLPLYIARNYFEHRGYKDQARDCHQWLERLGQHEIQFGLGVEDLLGISHI